MAYYLVKAFRRAGHRFLPPPLSQQRAYCSAHSYVSSSSCTSRCGQFYGGSKPCLGFADGLSSETRLRGIPHFTDAALLFASAKRFFCSDGGSHKEKPNKGEEVEDEEEFIAEDDGKSEEEDDYGEDDDLELFSEKKAPLPRFKDHAEEAAYIGYKVIGNVKAGDFGRFGTPRAFAVVQVGSHQFKISPGDCIYTEKLKFADINDKLSLEKVMLLGSKTQTIIGRPYVPKAYVHAAVEEQVLDAKVLIFKKKRRKNYRRCNGHRQELTRLRILEIRGLGEARSAMA